jgi:hypothetical protein
LLRPDFVALLACPSACEPTGASEFISCASCSIQPRDQSPYFSVVIGFACCDSGLFVVRFLLRFGGFFILYGSCLIKYV